LTASARHDPDTESGTLRKVFYLVLGSFDLPNIFWAPGYLTIVAVNDNPLSCNRQDKPAFWPTIKIIGYIIAHPDHILMFTLSRPSQCNGPEACVETRIPQTVRGCTDSCFFLPKSLSNCPITLPVCHPG
jgi:hypothetical protein